MWTLQNPGKSRFVRDISSRRWQASSPAAIRQPVCQLAGFCFFISKSYSISANVGSLQKNPINCCERCFSFNARKMKTAAVSRKKRLWYTEQGNSSTSSGYHTGNINYLYFWSSTKYILFQILRETLLFNKTPIINGKFLLCAGYFLCKKNLSSHILSINLKSGVPKLWLYLKMVLFCNFAPCSIVNLADI